MNILIVSPHPDDDAIGCSGTIAKHVKDGDYVHTLYLTSGELGGDPQEREAEAGIVSQILHTQEVTFWRLPDGDFGKYLREEEVNKVFEGIEVVYVPHEGEAHSDHQLAYYLVHGAVRGSSIEVREYEVWTPLQAFDILVDITEFVSIKRAAIRAHRTQILNAFEDAALALNHYRGIIYGPNIMYAEVFRRRQ